MGTFLAIVVGILVFMFLVIIHELGHFWTARASGVKVLEFGVGIPPKATVLAKDKKGTEYTLNWIPLGGFVRLKGEDPMDKQTFTARDSFMQAKVWQKVLILLGGVIVNFLFAWIVFAILFMVGMKPFTVVSEEAVSRNSYLMPTKSFLIEKDLATQDDLGKNPEYPVVVASILPDTPASDLGLQKGDIIASFGGRSVSTSSLKQAIKTVSESSTGIIILAIERDGVLQNFSFPCVVGNCTLGIEYEEAPEYLPVLQFGFFKSFVVAAEEMYGQSAFMLTSLGTLGKALVSFDGGQVKKSLQGFSGPVGAVGIGQTIYTKAGVAGYVAFAAMISLALAVFNLLPIPALDGGRLLGVLIQSGFRLPKEKYFVVEGYLNFIFFILLLVLGIYIIFKDLHTVWGFSVFG